MLLHKKNDRREASSDVGDAIRRIRRGSLRLTLESEQELRADEDAANRQFEARLKSALRRAIAVSGQRDLKILVGHGPSIGAPREGRDDFLCAGRLVGGRRGLADEQPAAAGRIVASPPWRTRLRKRGAGNRHTGNTRLAIAGPVRIATQGRVEQIFEERRGLLEEIHLNQMGAGLHRHAELKRLLDFLGPLLPAALSRIPARRRSTLQTLARSRLTSS